MEYQIKTIEKTGASIEVSVDFLKDGEFVEVRKWSYALSLSEEDLKSAIERDCQGVIADHAMFAENAERDRIEKESGKKIEHLKTDFGLNP